MAQGHSRHAARAQQAAVPVAGFISSLVTK
jgi:hypothetical protein